jgi:sterol desaturase/sphingolipid hydroxylase (fatty acid hydroxylase superfamily)
MSSGRILAISSILMLPVLYVAFIALHLGTLHNPLNQWLPHWDRLLILVTIIGLERLYTYRYAVSQRHMLIRDSLAYFVNVYIAIPVVAFLLLPLLHFIPEHFLGQRYLLASPRALGPVWLQIPVLLVSVSLFRYWMHRWQHSNAFLWKLHSYHHLVTDLKAMNGEFSHPVDFALRQLIVFFALGIVGFSPLALLISFTVANISAVFSHCGADLRGGFLNYLFVTPEVHRWHHAADVPQGYGYSCNYGVEFSFWDVVFGTYYLPYENGEALQPARLCHPSGLPDERNYLKILLDPFGLYRPLTWLLPKGHQPAE